MNGEEGIVMTDAGFWQCLKCLKQMTVKNSALRHYRNVHLEPEKVSCKYCPKVFKHKESHVKHLNYVHGITKRMLKHRVIPSETT